MKRTVQALLSRGFDNERANKLADKKLSLNKLKLLKENELKNLGIPTKLVQVILKEPRPPIPPHILKDILYANRSKCCVCRGDGKSIIVHHISSWHISKSHDKTNLAVQDDYLIVVNGRKGDPYFRLINAKETSIALVIIDGQVRSGRPSLFLKLAPESERVQVGRTFKSLNLLDKNTHEFLQDLTLEAATEKLAYGLKNIKKLKQILDSSKTEKHIGAIPIGGPIFKEESIEPGEWFLDLDHQDSEHTFSRLDLVEQPAMSVFECFETNLRLN